MKRATQEAYVENPGLKCDLSITTDERLAVVVTAVFKNTSDSDLFLVESLIPHNVLRNQIFSIKNSNTDNYLEYSGSNLSAEHDFQTDKRFLVKRKSSINFSCNLNSYFRFVKDSEYEIRYSEFLPLIKHENHKAEKQNGHTIFFRLRSGLVKFHT